MKVLCAVLVDVFVLTLEDHTAIQILFVANELAVPCWHVQTSFFTGFRSLSTATHGPPTAQVELQTVVADLGNL
jgi:hypothetical protein